MKNKLVFLLITLVINSVIFFSDEVDQFTLLILFNVLLIYILVLNISSLNYRKKKEEENSQFESADNHPIIVSARKRLNKTSKT